MNHQIFVEASGGRPLDPGAFPRLATALGAEVRELDVHPNRWSGVFSVPAVDIDEAARLAFRRAAAAHLAVGLSDWECCCWDIREELVRLADDEPHWHLRLPRRHITRTRAASGSPARQ